MYNTELYNFITDKGITLRKRAAVASATVQGHGAFSARANGEAVL